MVIFSAQKYWKYQTFIVWSAYKCYDGQQQISHKELCINSCTFKAIFIFPKLCKKWEKFYNSNDWTNITVQTSWNKEGILYAGKFLATPDNFGDFSSWWNHIS